MNKHAAIYFILLHFHTSELVYNCNVYFDFFSSSHYFILIYCTYTVQTFQGCFSQRVLVQLCLVYVTKKNLEYEKGNLGIFIWKTWDLMATQLNHKCSTQAQVLLLQEIIWAHIYIIYMECILFIKQFMLKWVLGGLLTQGSQSQWRNTWPGWEPRNPRRNVTPVKEGNEKLLPKSISFLLH